MKTIGGITLATRISKQRISEGISPYRSASSFRGLESLRAHYPKDQGKRILSLIPFSLSSFSRLDSAFNFFSPLNLLLPRRLFSCQLGVLKEQLGNRTENFSKKFLIAKTPAQGTKIGHPEATSSGLKTIIGLNQGFKRVR
ncbi:hypothetical protein ACXM2N_10690 [Corynebacterium sp. ZY180755]